MNMLKDNQKEWQAQRHQLGSTHHSNGALSSDLGHQLKQTVSNVAKKFDSNSNVRRSQRMH